MENWITTTSVKSLNLDQYCTANYEKNMEMRKNSNSGDSCSCAEESIVTSQFVENKLEQPRNIDSSRLRTTDGEQSTDMKPRTDGGGVARIIQKLKLRRNKGETKSNLKRNNEEGSTSKTWRESAIAAVDNLRGKLAFFRRARSLESRQDDDDSADQQSKCIPVERTQSAPGSRANCSPTVGTSPLSIPSHKRRGIARPDDSEVPELKACTSFHCLPTSSVFCKPVLESEKELTNSGLCGQSTGFSEACTPAECEKVVHQQPLTGDTNPYIGVQQFNTHSVESENVKPLGSPELLKKSFNCSTPRNTPSQSIDQNEGESAMLWNLRRALEGEVSNHLERQRYLSTNDEELDFSPRSTASGGTFFVNRKSGGDSADESVSSIETNNAKGGCSRNSNEVATCHKVGRSRADFLNAYGTKKTTGTEIGLPIYAHPVEPRQNFPPVWSSNDDVINDDITKDDATRDNSGCDVIEPRLSAEVKLEEVASRNLSLPLLQHFADDDGANDSAKNDVTATNDGDSPVTHHWSRHSSIESPGKHQIVRFFAEEEEEASNETKTNPTNLRSALSTSSDDILLSEDTSTSSSTRNSSELSCQSKLIQTKRTSPTNHYRKAQSPLTLSVVPTHHFKRRQRAQITRPHSTTSSGSPSPSSPTVSFHPRRLPHMECSTDSNDSLDSNASRSYTGRRSLSRIFRRASSQRTDCPPTFCGYTMGRDRCVDETTDRIFKEFLLQDKPGVPDSPMVPNEPLPPPSHMLPPCAYPRDSVTALRRQVMRKQYSDSIAMFYGQRMRRMKVSKQTSGSLDCAADRGILRRQDKVEEEFDPEEISEQMVGSTSHRRESEKPEYIPPTIHELKEWRRSSCDRKPVLRHTNSLPSDTSSPDVRSNDHRTPVRRVSFVHE